ncbi:hypothetical protein EDD80_10757 [Anseongella ginsenosidimutans]|uniref:Uncharacterized protein n=1 Tax=Anseongella ginsenosidimutans TaxID=496056 RepID=A0A4R3KPZ0_9SPHI|nr:hypothetical protein [Anseongella ginsenosidimutans]TCS86524.1 hypothetical protein EDD80_10757 [Anseongella ginsenosidimutans]
MRITYLLLPFLLIANLVKAQVPVNLSGWEKKSGVEVNQDGKLLNITWMAGESPNGNDRTGGISISLEKEAPLFHRIMLNEGGDSHEIASAMDPVFLLTVGKRNLDVERNDTKLGWTIFFDNPSASPFETYPVVLDKEDVQVVSEGAQTRIIVGGAEAGPFTGAIEITLFRGSPLVNMAAVMQTEKDSLAIIYDAGLVSKQQPWEKLFWSDPQDYLQDRGAVSGEEAQTLAVKYRTIIGQGEEGSLAVFPPPHQYFYPLDNCYNFNHTWFGTGYRDLVPGYGIGIRHELLGDRRWVPWFNAPPHTKQRLNFFCLLSAEKDGKVLEEVKQFTHEDKYLPVPGYYTMSSHFHTEHTDDVLTHKPLPEIPGFVKAFRNTGVNIVHLGEFHGPGSPRGPEIERFSELQLLFAECERLSSGNFLLLPGEEPNNFFGGHWMNIFPNPVYWVMSRDEGEAFTEQHPVYGKIYRIGDTEDMMRLLEEEKGLAWTAHPRIKGSAGYPDKYKDEAFYRSDRFLGGAWKAMPADLSQDRLGTRVLDLLDDMANWGQKKQVIAEADLFKVEPEYELYGHMNVNYLQMEELPEFEDGWQPVLDAMQQGKFFSTTGEILLPSVTLNGKGPGETAAVNGKATLTATVSWTFPLAFAEIISGDGKEVYRERISLKDTEAFGKKTFEFPVNLENRKWVRLEVWDAAVNGAFTPCIWLE